MEPQTAEEMQKMMECAYISNYQLNIQYAYRDENGKIQFVDKDGNPIMDWRREYVFSLDKVVLIDENGNIISETGYEEGYMAYEIESIIGDTETMKKYQSEYEKYKEYLDKYKEYID